MLVMIATHLIAYALGGLTMFYVSREYWGYLAEWEERLNKRQADANLENLQTTPMPDVTFVQPDPTKRKPGRPRKVHPGKEPVVLTRQTGRRTH